ncbi:MAG: plcC [Conexibacter sp.]|nr:plcC [Conexibacter sp.]
MRRIKTLACGGLVASIAAAGLAVAHADTSSSTTPASTPIKHVVVIFGENVSFDHYFGTYPNATNPAGEPRFQAEAGTPAVNGLSDALLNSNPNALNPQRLDRSRAVTCSQNHGYGAEQSAYDHGLMDRFVERTAGGGALCPTPIVMDYYDGNTLTGLWNLAQSFSMSDNSYSTNFGPSTVGALNLISGQTHGASAGGNSAGTVIGDPDPSTALDDCATGGTVMSGKNVGDLLSAHHVTWGWFQGGFRPSSVDSTTGRATCSSSHVNVAGATVRDYSPHHEPFQYYASTANIHHTAPASAALIGKDDPAGTAVGQKVNHQYDLTDFDTALASGNLPGVSFLKAAAFEDAHPSNSDPLDEQRFVARTLNALQQSPDWSSTAVIIAYDDSDGWYDHQMSPIVNHSQTPDDTLTGTDCGAPTDTTGTAYQGRCGYGPRQPLLVVSPFAKQNFVDHSVTDQTSVLKFIEDNWQLGRIGDQSFDARAGSLGNMFNFDADAKLAPKVFLDPTTGEVTKTTPATDEGGTTPTTTTPSGGDPGDGSHTGDGGQSGGGKPGHGGGKPTTGQGHGPKRPDITVTCATTRHGSRLTVACRVTGKDAKTGATALRFRVERGNEVVATTRSVVRKGHAAAVLKTKSALHGKFTLRIAIAHSGSASASTARALRL